MTARDVTSGEDALPTLKERAFRGDLPESEQEYLLQLAAGGEDAQPDHQAHGHCQSCRYPVHQYPFGWQHVGSGMFACGGMIPVATCCAAHGEGYEYIGPYGVPVFAPHRHGLTVHQHDGGALPHEHIGGEAQ